MDILAAIAMTAAIQPGIPSQTVQANIVAPGPAGPLKGTLLSPANQDVPVVLIVPGSGPTDRNGNGQGGLRASTYRLLAEGLLSHGIASVRIDKRGMYGSASVATGMLATMGPGLPFAIAAQLANPGRQVVAIVGDGGLAMLMA